MSSQSGTTPVVPVVSACTPLTWQINVSFVALGFSSHMAMLPVEPGNGLAFWSALSLFIDCSAGLRCICERTRTATRLFVEDGLVRITPWPALYIIYTYRFTCLLSTLIKHWFKLTTAPEVNGSFCLRWQRLASEDQATVPNPVSRWRSCSISVACSHPRDRLAFSKVGQRFRVT